MMDQRNAYGFPLDIDHAWMGAHDAALSSELGRLRMQEALTNCFTPPRQITKLQRAQAIAKEVAARRFPVKKLAIPLEN